MRDTQYYQCHLQQGDLGTTGWIEARGAKVGAKVNLPTIQRAVGCGRGLHPQYAGASTKRTSKTQPQ